MATFLIRTWEERQHNQQNWSTSLVRFIQASLSLRI
jgi:hypothetical protein